MRLRRPAPLPGTDDPAAPARPRRGRVALLAVSAAVAGLLVGAGGPGWASHTFTDVPTSHPFHNQISWLASVGVTGGFGGGEYRPSEPVTRGSMAAFLQRLHNLRDVVSVKAAPGFFAVSTTDGVWVDVGSGAGAMSAQVTVPPGTTATLVARYGAESTCTGTGNSSCFVRLMRGATEMGVGHNTSTAFDSVGTDGSESHLVERWLTNVPPGTHTVRVQATTGGGGVSAYTLDNQTLVVEAILNKAPT